MSVFEWKLDCHKATWGVVLKQGLVSEADGLNIIVDDGVERASVRLQGRLGLDSSPALRDRLLAMLQGHEPKTVVVDLTEVSYIDASGVATLLEALKTARSHHGTLCLKGLQNRMARLLEVAGLLEVFDADSCKSAAQS